MEPFAKSRPNPRKPSSWLRHFSPRCRSRPLARFGAKPRHPCVALSMIQPEAP